MRLVLCLFHGVIVTFIIACLCPNPALAQKSERRVALVIGMSKYKAEAQLPNAANDARVIAETLRRIGFDVDLAMDTGVSETRQRLRRFADKADGAAQAVFYFAGHGMQVNGVNHLLPVDALLERERDLPDETVDLERIMVALTNASARIVILDACRNNPLVRTMQPLIAGRSSHAPGLSQVQRVDAGTLIAFSTSPNTVAMDGAGANSPFTAALSKHIATPGLEIRQVFSRVRADVLAATGGRQLPWDSSSLVVDVFLNPPAVAAAAPTAKPDSSAAPLAPRSTEESDRLFWASIKDSGDIEEYKIYLQQFPNGIFAALARQRLATLQSRAKPVETPAPAPSPAPAPKPPPAMQPAAAPAPPPAAADAKKPYDPERLPFVPRPVPEILKGLTSNTDNWVLAIARGGGWGLKTYADVADSTRGALETCEFFALEPCFVYAVRRQLVDGNEKASFSPQPQPGLRQNGAKFDAARVPFHDSPTRQQMARAVSAAPTGSGHWALAISFRSNWAFRADADSVTAQREALAACNLDPRLRCFIFAIDGKVVMREGGPDKQISAQPPPAGTKPPVVAGVTLSERRYDAQQIPFLARPIDPFFVDLANRPLMWTLAIAPSGGNFSYWSDNSPDIIRRTLEGCEFLSQQACFPYAVSGWVVDSQATKGWVPQPQAFLRQTNQRFDPLKTPFLTIASQERVKSWFAKLPAGQRSVLAVTAAGHWYSDNADRAEGLQQRVLSMCNQSNPVKRHPCFVYAVDGTVVMRNGDIRVQITQ